MSPSTSWTLFASNHEAWNSMLEDCNKARKSIVLEQFIFTNDDFGQKLIDVCIERAKAGVEVRFLWDAAGSFSFFGSNLANELREKGIKLLFWKTLIPGYFKVPNYRSWFLRNHRRTLVIDEKVGYTGSICIKDSMKNWRDTNVRLEGPVAISMERAFDKMWVHASGRRYVGAPRPPRDAEFTYQVNSPTPGQKFLYRNIVEAVRSAEHYIYITTPYFVPPPRLVRVIKLAAHRGVDVRIILPEKSDHYPALDLGARSFFHTLFKSGVRIFLYGGNVIHSKTIIVDGTWATVGSLNLDNASLLYNYEANIVSLNSKFNEELAAHFVHDMNKSKEIDPREWNSRFFIEKIPEFAIKVVRRFL
jgi:cardiolipin synthase A/B